MRDEQNKITRDCVAHHHACDCREAMFVQEAEKVHDIAIQLEVECNERQKTIDHLVKQLGTALEALNTAEKTLTKAMEVIDEG